VILELQRVEKRFGGSGSPGSDEGLLLVRPLEPELSLHQIEHRRHRLLGGEIEILVEAECDPCVRDARDRRAELEVAELERHLRALERGLDSGARHLAVALRGMAIAR